MELYSIDLGLVLWTVFWIALVVFVGIRVYKFFKK